MATKGPAVKISNFKLLKKKYSPGSEQPTRFFGQLATERLHESNWIKVSNVTN